MRIRLGLKAWSTNLSLIPKAARLFGEGELDYVEVFCVPGHGAETAAAWESSDVPYVVHAPHSLAGLNFSDPEKAKHNASLTAEVLWFAERLRADKVIFHPGTGGEPEETVKQMRKFLSPNMILENKPYRGLDGTICVGSRPEELHLMTAELGLGFCLDFGHGIAAANSHHEEIFGFLGRFMALGPCMFHLTDGDLLSELDHHDRYGEGSFPLAELLALVPDGALVTDEAKRADPNSVEDYLGDRNYAKALLERGHL